MNPVAAPHPPGADTLEEIPLGGTPAGRAANAALRALSKAARACTLYDARNEAIRLFLHDYRESVAALLAAHGPVELEVRSFELVLRGEVVHTEKDRERSLAYRLFRDGIRKLQIEPGVTWEELQQLLEVLSVRFIGVRQQEEDVVTLLTRAAFRSIHFTAVAGFAARDEDEDGDVITEDARSVRTQGGATFAVDFDAPVPTVLPPRPLGYFPLPATSIAAFEAEEAPERLPGHAVRMIRELIDGATPAQLVTLVPAVGEVRDYLLAESQLGHLRDLAQVIAIERGQSATILGPALHPLAAGPTLQRLLATVAPGAPAPDELVELLDVLTEFGADLLDPLLDRMAASFAAGAKEVEPTLHALAVRAARKRADHLLERLATADPVLVPELVSLLRATAAPRLAEAARVLFARAELPLQLEALSLLGGLGAGEGVTTKLLSTLQSPHQPLRIRAAELLAQYLERRAFPAITQLVLAREPKGLDAAEADAMGEALATVAPREAAQLFASWLHVERKGLLGRLAAPKPRRMLAWTAAAGLAHLPGGEALALLKEIAAQADDDLRRRCAKSGALRRRAGHDHG